MRPLLTLDQIEEAAAMLKQGAVIGFPTDTVYGIGAAYSHYRAIERIFAIKGRPLEKPLIPLLRSVDQTTLFAEEFPQEFLPLAARFWPGPLTLVLKKKKGVPDLITAGGETIGLRIPDHSMALRLLDLVGEPIVTTSANISGGTAPTCAQEVDINLSCDALLCDTIETRYQKASTVLSLVDGLKILREGPINMSDIQNHLKYLQRA